MTVRATFPFTRSFVIITLALVAAGCGDHAPQNRLTEFDGETQGTTYHIKVVDLPAAASPAMVRSAIESELADITRHLSTYTPDSELSRFNRSRDTGWVPASTDLVDVLSEARRVSELTHGAYDVTVAPLVNLCLW